MIGLIASLIIAIVILIISLVYASRASTELSKVKGYSKDPDLSRASSYLIWICTVGWIAVIAAFFGIIALYEDIAAAPGLLYGAVAIIAILILIVGIIVAMSTNFIDRSSIYTNNTDSTAPIAQAHTDALFSTFTAIGSLILVLIGVAITYYYDIPSYVRNYNQPLPPPIYNAPSYGRPPAYNPMYNSYNNRPPSYPPMYTRPGIPQQSYIGPPGPRRPVYNRYPAGVPVRV